MAAKRKKRKTSSSKSGSGIIQKLEGMNKGFAPMGSSTPNYNKIMGGGSGLGKKKKKKSGEMGMLGF